MLGATAARGTAIVLTVQVVRISIGLATMVVLARLLLPSDFGLVAVALAIVSIAELFRDFGLYNAGVKAVNLSRRQSDNLFWANVALGVVCGLVVAGAAAPTAHILGAPELRGILLALSPLFVLNGLATQFRVRLNRDLRYTALTMCDLIPQLVGSIGAVALAVLEFGYWALVAQPLLAAVSGLLFATLFAGWIPRLPSRDGESAGLLRVGGHLVGTNGVAHVVKSLDRIGLGWQATSSVVGQYDRALSLLLVPLNQVQGALTKVALPVLVRASDDKDRYRRYVEQAHNFYAYLSCTAFGVMAALAPQLVAVMFGDGWGLAGQLLRLLAIGGCFRSLVQIHYWVYLSLGLTSQQLRFYAIAYPLVGVGILAGLPWGAVGVAIAHTVAYAGYWAASAWWLDRCAGVGMLRMERRATGVGIGFVLPVSVAAHAVGRGAENALVGLILGSGTALLVALLVGAAVPAFRRDWQRIFSLGLAGIGRRI